VRFILWWLRKEKSGHRLKPVLLVRVSLVAPLGRLHVIKSESLFVEDGGATFSLIAPCGYVGIALIVAKGFSLRSLVLFAEVPTAGFVAVQGVDAHQFGELEEVR
jgi:hypothetical protein